MDCWKWSPTGWNGSNGLMEKMEKMDGLLSPGRVVEEIGQWSRWRVGRREGAGGRLVDGNGGEMVENRMGQWSRWSDELEELDWWNGAGGLLSPDREEGGEVVGGRRLSHAAAG